MTHQTQATETGITRANEILRRLAPAEGLLRADAAASDASGAIAPAVTAAIREAGGYRLSAHGEVGGAGLVRVAAGLASVHASAAWNLVVSHTNSLLAQSFARLSGTAFPADPDAQWCGVFASTEAHAVPQDAGSPGWVVDGVWRYASNSDLAEWALLNVATAEHGAGFVWLPRAALAVQSRWAALGLRATGSHTLAATQLEVPSAAFLPTSVLFGPEPDGPLALRVPSRLRTALGLAAVGVGAAEALVAGLAASIQADADRARVAALPGRGIDRPGVAQTLGAAHARARSARAALFATADELDIAVAHGDPLPAAQLTEARLMLGHVTADVAAATHELSLIAGSRACLEGDAVGRLWRDAHVITRHAALSPTVGFELGARALIDPGETDVHAAVGPLAPAN
ncbi:blr5615; hypothetical protein [Leucobacter sp. 7(1)]|uniref:hypothetical protein n=1 Tax=Leucobacter sp. 7(1) TaxID=1255613 RepID=UPI00097E81AA|nr:hypothetical protein [Leucobacter sp. 7(1)]SJN11946.1 blr5615; hypothetical protein [Leucobacter sp. 7(1)]